MRPLPGLAAASVLLWGCGPAAPRMAATPVPEASATAGVSSALRPTAGASAEPEPIPAGRASPPERYDDGVDVLHYDIELALPRGSGWMQGHAALDLRLDRAVTAVDLDFSGLHIDEVTVDSGPVEWHHEDGLLSIPLGSPAEAGARHRIAVAYRGVPDDGLILGETVHGDPSAFVDNWPNRTRFWLPSVDHPSDKATARFTVHAPAEWDVIANGRAAGPPVPTPPEVPGPSVGERRTWIYETAVDHPTYTLVVGGADMVIDTVGLAACGEAPVSPRADGCVAVTTWLFPDSRAEGASSFRRAADMVDVFTDMIGPFPYEKLANVQSATRFGGMENSSAIFYSQQAIAAGRDIESTVSHEIAHQWFGDSVTEADWSELWLSEGFATYFGAVYFERVDGMESFRERLAGAARAYLTSADTLRPVIDRRGDLFDMLNRNSYQKGGWVLHMLRREVGDDAFFAAIRAYYARYRDATATTDDLRAVFEEVADRDLARFFGQWLRAPGYPVLSVSTRDLRTGLRVEIEQVQGDYAPRFHIPVDVEVTWDGRSVRATVPLEGAGGVWIVPGAPADARVTLDPDGWLLHRLHGSPPSP
ncbi:MAG: M1 family metallopeptidase [Gemmatimonadetes bacterium]|nr:M1 family metallopeptidase [Gemmatimonadota bacterium]